jgi:Ca2+-binding RTX toxin-like protein
MPRTKPRSGGRRAVALVAILPALLLATAALSSPAGAASNTRGGPTCFGRQATMVGTANRDEIEGTAHTDVIVARGGNDEVHGRGGADFICGGRGADHLEGNLGNDHLNGGRGADVLDGGPGTDVCISGMRENCE